MEFPYKEMVREWNGSFVHVSEFEPKQPQLEPKPNGTEGVALRNIRPEEQSHLLQLLYQKILLKLQMVVQH